MIACTVRNLLLTPAAGVSSARCAAVSWTGHVTSADSWNRTFQNRQSEFLAVASMAALAIYPRRRGSPESRPVGSAHASTGVEG